MQDTSKEKLINAVVNAVFTLEEPIEDQLKLLHALLFFIESYQLRNKGYQLRKQMKGDDINV